MSCRCAHECKLALERYNPQGSVRFISLNDKICFTHRGHEPQLSDVPADLSDVTFYARYSLSTPGWEGDATVAATRVGRVLGAKPRWAENSSVGIKAIRPVRSAPRPVSSCPHSCSDAGTCVEYLGGGAVGFHCVCHAGFRGAVCNETDAGECINGCSAHGSCFARFCRCNDGWFGLDCSLSLAGSKQLESRRAWAPTYAYPLPTDLSMEFVYQRDPRWRGMFYTNRVYLEVLHSRRDALVADPEDAALFFIPVMLSQMANSLWEGREFLTATVNWIRGRYPFWNRTGGADHYIFTGQDLGGCWMPEVLRSSIIVSHFGFRAAESVWLDLARWELAKVTRDGWLPGRDPAHWHPACFHRKKDVTVPVDFRVPPFEREHQLASLAAECGVSSSRSTPRVLVYMAGAIKTRWNDVYSQGVREYFYEQHQNSTEVSFELGRWNVSSMRNATFCLAPSGWGYGWRVYVSLAMNCIPVIIQPLVDQVRKKRRCAIAVLSQTSTSLDDV